MKARLYRRRYIVPNLITLANMFCGFLAIIYAANGRFDKATLAIGIAILLDGLDGRVARRLNATSKFGLEFDSFSDLVSFGVAPALMVYFWSMKPAAEQFGVFVCFIYALCAAARLARFNISAESLKAFTGLPSPGAAAVVAATVNFFPGVHTSTGMAVFGSLLMLVPAFCMISTIEFLSVKQFKVQNMNLPTFIALGAAIALTWYDPEVGLLVLAGAYLASGPLLWFRKRSKKILAPETSEQTSGQ
jgi:CDP-diacylglycerol--serine O-phosphatidyltransferase